MSKIQSLWRTILTLHVIFNLSKGQDSNSSLEDLIDRSHFEGYEFVKRFLIMDFDPSSIGSEQPKGYYYYFNLMAEKVKNENSLEEHPQKFFFDMFDYNKVYPSKVFGNRIIKNELELLKDEPIELGHHMLTEIVLPNNFYKLEANISENDCLTLFMFLDSKPLTDMTLIEKSHDVLFDLTANPKNNFYFSVKNYFGHSRDSFDIVYNDIGSFDEKVYLKVACPFFSAFGSNQIKLNLKLIPSNHSDFYCKI